MTEIVSLITIIAPASPVNSGLWEKPSALKKAIDFGKSATGTLRHICLIMVVGMSTTTSTNERADFPHGLVLFRLTSQMTVGSGALLGLERIRRSVVPTLELPLSMVNSDLLTSS